MSFLFFGSDFDEVSSDGGRFSRLEGDSWEIPDQAAEIVEA